MLASPRRVAVGLALAAGLAACGNTSDSSVSGAASSAAGAASSVAGAASSASSALGAGVSASASLEASASASGATASGSITANDQTSNGMTVTVARVELTGVKQGWIAVHRNVDGKPGPVVGHVQIQSGTSTDVVVPLDSTVATADYWPMLHVDTNTLGQYEFPQVEGADLPVKDNGMIVMKKITLTVN